MTTHLHFTLPRKEIVDRILIPKFYDPDLSEAVSSASSDFDLPTLGSLLLPGKAGSQLGIWLPRENYGSGEVPFVRTSDLYHWRIRPDFKKGVSQEVYERYAARSDVKVGDILFVAHGTYLIGDVAVVEEKDVPLLLQDHVFRLRVRPDSGVHPYLLLAALSTKFVRRQVRARQFSAEILDKIGERHVGIRVPIPKSKKTRSALIEKVAAVLAHHREVRERIAEVGSARSTPGPRAGSHYGFRQKRSTLKNRILIPRYYDPELEAEIAEAEAQERGGWVSISELAAKGLIEVSTGVEVGKMAYGTGDIPFMRTSDIVDWELFRDPTQGVSQKIYDDYSPKGVLAENDVVLVRDGTYLVGSSALVLDEDLPALFCGGIYRLRSPDPKAMSPHALLGLLNLPLVKRQLRAKQFTRDVIDTLGPRFLEVRVPPPTSRLAAEMATRVRAVMERKAEIKRGMSQVVELAEPVVPPSAVGRPGWSMR